MSGTLRELSEAATPGPWKQIWHGTEKYPFPLSIHTADDSFWVARDGATSSAATGAFIVALVNAYRSGELVERSDPSPRREAGEPTQAQIDAAAAYWKEKATYLDQEMFRLPGGFFWCELLKAAALASAPETEGA